MQNFLAGQDIALTIDVSDVGMEFTAISYDVVDANGVVVIGRTAVIGPVAGLSEIVVTVPTVSNVLLAGETIAARSVTLYITGTGLAAGITAKSVTYALVAQDRLPAPSVSFQSLVSAEMIAFDLVNIDGWDSATDRQRVSALMEARSRLVRLRYRWVPGDYQSRVSSHVELTEYWFNSMSDDEWFSMDEFFKEALRRAQVVEAAYILTTDPDAQYRAAGVTSVTIGESSKSFLSTRSAKLSVSTRAMQILARYIDGPRLTRA